MADVYSTYEAKAKFSEIIRKVRAGRRVTIAYRGKPIAEVTPLPENGDTLEARVAWLRERGVLSGARPVGEFRPIAERPGALKRFLDERE